MSSAMSPCLYCAVQEELVSFNMAVKQISEGHQTRQSISVQKKIKWLEERSDMPGINNPNAYAFDGSLENVTQLFDVHETAAGALWNLAFNPGNAWRIVEEGGVPALVHLCSASGSKMARFMAALALAYMFDGSFPGILLNYSRDLIEQKQDRRH
eukprot:Gb_21669 [translate_table: standard]